MYKKSIALFLSLLLYISMPSFSQTMDEVLSLVQDYQLNQAYEALKSAIENDPTNKANYLLALLEMDDFNGDATKMLENAISLLDSSPSPLAEMLGHYYIGKVYYLRYDDVKALLHFENMLTLAQKHDLPFGEHLYYYFSGLIAYSYKDYPLAQENLNKSSEVLKKIKQMPLVLFDYYRYQSQFFIDFLQIVMHQSPDNQVELLKSLILQYENTSQYMDLIVYQEIGSQFIQIKDYNEAIRHLEHAKHLIETYGLDQNASLSLGLLYSNLANAYYHTQNYEAAAHLLMGDNKETDFESEVKVIENFNESLRSIETRAIRASAERQKKIIFTISILITLLIISLLIILKEYFKIKSLKSDIEEQSIRDGLTGLYNRKKIIETFEQNHQTITSVAILDIDDFKRINDTYGHLVGDDVLKTIATTISDIMVGNGFVGRYGGEEFLIVMENTCPYDLAESIRKAIENIHWTFFNEKITVSIGLLCQSNALFDVQFKIADDMLYKAKNSGKNKICQFNEAKASNH